MESTYPKLVEQMQAQLSPEVSEALLACLQACEALGASLFLVGGAVRDLMLGLPLPYDIDVATEADVETVLKAAGDKLGPQITRHERFGTAVLVKHRLDIARTRRETYAQPGALPDVEPATIEGDLARRDFTINAMALRLNQPIGELIDPLSGQRDLKARLIRVLHEGSFQDDATRMIRAVRYATRLGFAIEHETRAWLQRDLPYVDAVTGARLRNELTRCLREPAAAEAMLVARDLGLLKALHSGLDLPDEVATRWRAIEEEPEKTGLCLLLWPAEASVVESVSQRLHLQGDYEAGLREIVRLELLSPGLAAAYDDPVEVVTLLQGAPSFAVRALAIRQGGRVAEACEAYLTRWQHVAPELKGNDLIALGLPFGPRVGEMLWQLGLARLRGEVTSKEQEIELVQRELEARRG